MKARTGIRRRAADHDEEDFEGSWAVSYGDLITLLLSFFILFFSVEPPSPRSRHEERRMLEAIFSVLEHQAGIKPRRVGSSEAAESPGAGEGRAIASAPEKAAGGAAGKSGSKPTGHTASLDFGKGDSKGIDEQALRNLTGIPQMLGDRILIQFPSISFYGSGMIDITPEGRAALVNFVRAYIPYAGTNKLVVRAFTDPRPVVGTGRVFRDNLELSALRAVSAMRVLRDAGVPLNRMRLGGYGELKISKEHDELESIPEERRPAAVLDLARKVVLVIEPEEAKL
jgi:flagellar motor protein MotB